MSWRSAVDTAMHVSPVIQLPLMKCGEMVGGKVRFYDGDRRIGSIAPDDGSGDVFVHATALERAGVFDLTEGRRLVTRRGEIP